MSDMPTSNPNPSALIELGRQATEVIAKLRQLDATRPAGESDWKEWEEREVDPLCERLQSIEDVMMFIPAKTLNELRAKVLVAAFNLEGQNPSIDPIEEAGTINMKIATSITVDLIDMFGERRKRT